MISKIQDLGYQQNITWTFYINEMQMMSALFSLHQCLFIFYWFSIAIENIEHLLFCTHNSSQFVFSI